MKLPDIWGINEDTFLLDKRENKKPQIKPNNKNIYFNLVLYGDK